MLFATYCQMRRISLPNGLENVVRYNVHFWKFKQLQRHDSVHLSSVYTDYCFSGYCIKLCHDVRLWHKT